MYPHTQYHVCWCLFCPSGAAGGQQPGGTTQQQQQGASTAGDHMQHMLLGARPMGGNAMPDFPSGGLDLVQHLNLDGIMLNKQVGCW
jgi:hypothetical protein